MNHKRTVLTTIAKGKRSSIKYMPRSKPQSHWLEVHFAHKSLGIKYTDTWNLVRAGIIPVYTTPYKYSPIMVHKFWIDPVEALAELTALKGNSNIQTFCEKLRSK